MLECKIIVKKKPPLTHIRLILERVLTAAASAMEVRRPLAGKRAIVRGAAFLGGAKPLEPLLNDGRVLAMVVAVHLHVRRANVHLVAVRLQTVVVRLFALVRTRGVLWRTVVARREPQEAVVQALVALLVPLQVANDLLLFGQDFAQTHDVVAVIVVALVLRRTALVAALQVAGEAAQVGGGGGRGGSCFVGCA